MISVVLLSALAHWKDLLGDVGVEAMVQHLYKDLAGNIQEGETSMIPAVKFFTIFLVYRYNVCL